MGLDWCLKRRARPGFEEEFIRLEAEDSDGWTEAEKQHWEEVSVDPYETLGVPRIGIDEAATKHFLEVIVPSHRENARENTSANDKYRQHWAQTDDVLLAEHTGAYATDLTDYDLSTFQVMTPFTSLAGAFSFRGKAIGYSTLLPESLQNEAYTDMTPPEMADYAARIERAAIAASGCPTTNPGDAREWVDETLAEMRERAIAQGFVDDDWAGLVKDGEEFKPEPREELALRLQPVLDAARWLRFWADLGHSMHAWY